MRREYRKENRPKERYCIKCGADISERHHLATLCWACRRKNAKFAGKRYVKNNGKKVKETQKDYYERNKKKIIKHNYEYQKKQKKKVKKIIDMDLPSEDGKADLWMEWDDLPRCECTIAKDNWFDICEMRASYRLKDKHDGTVRYVCNLHIKHIGNLKYYHIEKLNQQTIRRTQILYKWKSIKKEARQNTIKKTKIYLKW